MLLLLQTLIAIRKTTEDGHGHGLRFVREGGEDDAGFEWDSVYGLEGQRDYEVKCTEAAGNRY